MDPSQVYRPEDVFKEYNDFIVSRTDKNEKDFRNYDLNLQTDIVRRTYILMHENQTLNFVKEKVSGSELYNYLETYRHTSALSLYVIMQNSWISCSSTVIVICGTFYASLHDTGNTEVKQQ